MAKKNIILLTFIFLALTFVSYFFSDIVFYLISAIVFSFILRPLVNFLDRIRIGNISSPRWLMILLSYGFLIMLIYGFISVFIPLINEQQEKIKSLSGNDIDRFLIEELGKIESYLKTKGLLEDGQEGILFKRLYETKETLVNNISPSSVLNRIVSFTGSLLVSLLAILFISFFLLLEKGKTTKLFLSLITNSYFELTVKAIYQIKNLLSNYLIGLLVQMFSICILIYIGLTIFGVNYALSIAIFAAFINIVPYIGPIIGILFGILVGITTAEFSSVESLRSLFVQIISVFAIVQINDNIVLQPLIFSKSVKAHPVEIFIIIFAGASLGGILGMILAIPTYTVLRVSIMELLSGYKQYNVFRINLSK